MKGLIAAVCGIASMSAGADFSQMNEQVLALGSLTNAPAVQDAGDSDGIMKTVFFDSVQYKGKPAKVFAWIGVPETSGGKKIPGIVLVHGGGGTAFKEWVDLWNKKGFAAISIATGGQTDEWTGSYSATARNKIWVRHEWAGAPQGSTYGDTKEPLEDQWMYHAVAGTVLANSLLRSLPEVDESRIGVIGISWGGIITSTVMGIDPRFAFAIPVYGCGHLADSENKYGDALRDNEIYKNVWDPMIRMNRAIMPTLWLSWPEDFAFSPISQAKNYHAMPGAYMVSLIPRMGHSHEKGWNPPDSYAFAESIVNTGRPWGGMVRVEKAGADVAVEFRTDIAPEKAVLVSTTGAGFTGNRTWIETPAAFRQNDGTWIASAILPENTTAWFLNLTCSGLTLSSEFQTVE